MGGCDAGLVHIWMKACADQSWIWPFIWLLIPTCSETHEIIHSFCQRFFCICSPLWHLWWGLFISLEGAWIHFLPLLIEGRLVIGFQIPKINHNTQTKHNLQTTPSTLWGDILQNPKELSFPPQDYCRCHPCFDTGDLNRTPNRPRFHCWNDPNESSWHNNYGDMSHLHMSLKTMTVSGRLPNPPGRPLRFLRVLP